MKAPGTSVLGYALLGLIHQKSSSGYNLRKIFAETAMGSFSSSPGAIYPALERLLNRGLIEGKVEEGSGLRRRRIYRITRSGSEELKQWLSQPVTRDEILRGMAELMLRFAFTEQALGAGEAINFLRKLRVELDAYVPSLRQYLRHNGARMPLSGMLALDSGVRNYETLQRWVEYAIETYQTSLAIKNRLPKKSKKH
jgi:DNA-binding PadR family transcriptional regulator